MTEQRRGRFFRNVLWSWLGVGVNFLAGIVVSPYLVRKLGHEGYGIWTLVFTIVEYSMLLDLGFRSATMKYSAHYRATNEPEKINDIISTGLVYFSGVAAVLLLLVLLLARDAVHLFQISASYQQTFGILLAIVGFSWAVGSVFNVFSACLEGFQRFDISNRIWMITVGVRSVGVLVLLAKGYGLLGVGIWVVSTQLFGYLLGLLALRRVFPRFAPRLAAVRWRTFRQMASYGIHTFLATVSTQSLNQSPPLLIGHFWPAAFVGYYSLPVRLLQYSVELVSRVGLVTGSSAAELMAHGEWKAISKMAIYANRYCLTLYLPVAILLSAFGPELLQIWISPEFARQSAPLLPILALGTALGVAAQFNSSTVLFGLGRHQGYAKGLFVEALLAVTAMLWVIPRYGILGAVWVTSVLMILNRGLYTPWLLCRQIHCGYLAFLRLVYGPPAAVALPVLALAYWLKAHVLPGRSWLELFTAWALVGAIYSPLAFWICLESPHRAAALAWVRRRFQTVWPRAGGATAC